jgi:hypothetical protein
MKYGQSKWCYKCGGAKMNIGGESKDQPINNTSTTPDKFLSAIRNREGIYGTKEGGSFLRTWMDTDDGKQIFKQMGVTPVYGPANSILGWGKGDFFLTNPDDNSRANVNKADLDMINNPKELKKYLLMRGFKPVNSEGELSIFKKGGGFGSVKQYRNLDQLPFFQGGGQLPIMQKAGYSPYYTGQQYNDIPLPQEEVDKQRRALEMKSDWETFNPNMVYENRNGLGNVQSPQADSDYQVQQSFDKSTQNLLGKGRRFDDNANLKNRRFNAMGIGNMINYGIAGFAGMADRNMQQQYVSRMQNNPLSGILPFNDMRSDNVEYGYNTMQKGGIANAVYIGENPFLDLFKNGGMIKRKDGSYSKRGLWDNIRANKGSGKKPTKEMIEQERKIKNK